MPRTNGLTKTDLNNLRKEMNADFKRLLKNTLKKHEEFRLREPLLKNLFVGTESNNPANE